MDYYARPAKNGIPPEPLIHHIKLVADLAEKYAKKFGCGKIGRQLGLMHDVGKRTEAFQNVLIGKASKIDHAIVGGMILSEKTTDRSFKTGSKTMTDLIISLIAAHHNEIIRLEKVDSPDFSDRFVRQTNRTMAVKDSDEYNDIVKFVDDDNLLLNITSDDYLPIKDMTPEGKTLLARMLFSCLVDADYTASASYYNHDYTNETEPKYVGFNELITNLENYRNKIISQSDPDLPINKLRNQVYNDCDVASNSDKKIFTLTAPTGSAKTLALLKFALEYAKKYKKDRIFIILPFLSILSQNADIYKAICGEEVVLEIDSQVEYNERSKELADRWTSQIIITSSVNFFNTMFRSRASDLRCLHNITNSVIVFDECQTFPSDLLSTTLNTIRALSNYFNSTIMFSTATQPNYKERHELGWWINPEIQEIIKDPKDLYKKYEEIKNTKVKWLQGPQRPEQLYQLFKRRNSVLYVFNTVKKAQGMFDYLQDKYKPDELYLITSRLAPEHKSDVIAKVKERLKKDKKCIVVSTQCIEAGVDLDFKTGAREYAPLDSIVQTAGRINRNGKYKRALFIVFEHEESAEYNYPALWYFQAANITKNMAKDKPFSLNDLSKMSEYYKNLYSMHETSSDKLALRNEIDSRINLCNFKTISEVYNLIDSRAQNIVYVPYGDKYDELNNELIVIDNKRCMTKAMLRKYQSISVTLFSNKGLAANCERLSLLVHGQPVEETNLYILVDKSKYDSQKGLDMNKEGDALII